MWHLRLGRRWWWVFAVLIAAPALGLGLLGVRTVRLAQIERRQQVSDDQRRLAPLADAALGKHLTALQARLVNPEEGGPVAGAIRFELDEESILTFPEDRVWFAGLGQRPRAVRRHVAERVRGLVDNALTADAQGRVAEAAGAYREVARADPSLSAWSDLALARIRYLGGDAGALDQMTRLDWSRSEARSPGGVPVALLAATSEENVPSDKRSRFLPLLEATLAGLRSGRWWLSYEERDSFDAELTRLIGAASGKAALRRDTRLEQLAAIEQLARRTAGLLTTGETRFYSQSAHHAFLLLWQRHPGAPPSWAGRALTGAALSGLLESALRPVIGQRELVSMALRDRQSGEWLWRSGGAPTAVQYSAVLDAVRGWELVFGPAADDPALARQKLLWYGFIALLTCMLLVGTLMTVQVVRREMELARLQSDFVAAVTHEFKSPITGIRVLMERLSAGRVQTQQSMETYFTAMRRETDRLDQLVNRVLEASRIQAGKKQYHFELASLAQITASSLDRSRVLAEPKRIRIDFSAEEGIPSLSLDKGSIKEAIDNLIDNAIQYSPPGALIRVRLSTADDRVCLEVSDQGIGIDADELDSIFDRFYRGRRGARHNVKGTGLGLALVKAAAEAHGGTIAATSQAGQGSTFRLSLPVPKKSEDRG